MTRPIARSARVDRALRALAPVLALTLGCTGAIASPEGTGARGTTPPGDPAPPGTHALSCSDPYATELDPGSEVPARRLTRDEYVATIAALVPAPVGGLDALLPPDPSLDGFSNQVEVLHLSPLHVRRYEEASARVAATIVGSRATLTAIAGCDPAAAADRDGCIAAFVERFGRRAFRRPLTGAGDPAAGASTETGRFLALARLVRASVPATSTDPTEIYADVAAIVQAMLLSPHFLLRLEIGEPVEGRDDVRKLSGYEVATRLSFFTWGVGPDDALLAAAAEGRLDTADGVEAEVRRMLGDPRARDSFHRFFAEWLGLAAIEGLAFDPDVFASFGPETAQAMRAEIEMLLDDHAWAPGARFLDVYTAKYAYVDAQLASIYGVAAPAEPGLHRVDLGADDRRGGLLSTAGMLAMTSDSSRTSPIRRGYLVRAAILCDEPPPPPPGVQVPEPLEGETEADTLTRHTEDPACQSCHQKIDPIGLGLEMYDPIGAEREVDEAALRALGTFVDGLEAPEFFGAVELGERVAASEMASRCVADRMLRWAAGHVPGLDDACTLARLEQALDDGGGSFVELVVAIARSDAFRFKRIDPAYESTVCTP